MISQTINDLNLPKRSKHVRSDHHTSNLSIDAHEPIPKPKVGYNYLDIRKILNMEKENITAIEQVLFFYLLKII